MQKVQLNQIFRIIETCTIKRDSIFFYLCKSFWRRLWGKGTYVIRTLIFTLQGKKSGGGTANELSCLSRGFNWRRANRLLAQQAGHWINTDALLTALLEIKPFCSCVVAWLTLHQVKAMICIIANPPLLTEPVTSDSDVWAPSQILVSPSLSRYSRLIKKKIYDGA